MLSSLTHERARGMVSCTFDGGCMLPSTVWRITTERQKGEELEQCGFEKCRCGTVEIV